MTDRLLDLITDCIDSHDPDCPALAEHVADAIREAGWSRPDTVDGVEELQALPDGSSVLDRKSRLWRTYKDGDHDCVDLVGIPSEVPLPATVLYQPQETP